MAERRNDIADFAAAHKKSILKWAVVIVCGCMIFRGMMQIPQIRENRLQIASVQEQIEYEKNRQRETDSLMTRVDSDEYIEKVASEKLGLVKSNSKIFVDVSQGQ